MRKQNVMNAGEKYTAFRFNFGDAYGRESKVEVVKEERIKGKK